MVYLQDLMKDVFVNYWNILYWRFFFKTKFVLNTLATLFASLFYCVFKRTECWKKALYKCDIVKQTWGAFVWKISSKKRDYKPLVTCTFKQCSSTLTLEKKFKKLTENVLNSMLDIHITTRLKFELVKINKLSILS